LWPSSEWRDLPALAAAALRANEKYLRLAVRVATGDQQAANAIGVARREVAAAAANLEESFQRLLGEHRGPAIALKPVMTLMTYTRRFAVSIGALALVSDDATRPAEDALEPFVRAASAVLDDLADAIASRRTPAPFPQPGEVARTSVPISAAVSARLERLARQLKPLHDAVAEMIAAAPMVARTPAG
jgi:hypothetical protein